MPITITERDGSRSFSTNSAGFTSQEMRYIIRGSASEAEVMAELLDTAPQTLNSLNRQSTDVEPLYVDESDADTAIWEGVVKYGPGQRIIWPQRQTGESTFSFDTTGGSQHITQSLAAVARHAPPGKSAPDCKGAIGVTQNSVEGCDITVPVYSFSETHYLANAAVTDACKAAIFALTGKTNSSAFRGLAAGEVLFLGATGSKRGDEDWEIQFRFAASPNRANFTVGDITVPAKKGWEYMWVRYEDEEDAVAKRLVKRPTAVYIEKVYEAGDFAGLGI